MFVNILVALLVFLSSGWVVGCCSTLSIFLLSGVGDGTASFGDFLLVGCCSTLSIFLLFGVGDFLLVGCCNTLSIFLLLGVGEGTASFGDFLLVGCCSTLSIFSGLAGDEDLLWRVLDVLLRLLLLVDVTSLLSWDLDLIRDFYRNGFRDFYRNGFRDIYGGCFED